MRRRDRSRPARIPATAVGNALRPWAASAGRMSRKGWRALARSRKTARATISRGAELVDEAAAILVDQEAPAPRRASLRSGRERPVPGTARAVGWNCTNSRSARTAPARAAMASPSPVASGGLVVSA